MLDTCGRRIHEPDILDLAPTFRERPVDKVVCHRHVDNLVAVSFALLAVSDKFG